MDFYLFYIIFAPPWTTPGPYHIIYSGLNHHFRYCSMQKCPYKMIPSMFTPSPILVLCLFSTMHFHWFCLIFAPPWTTPGPTISSALAWIITLDVEACKKIHISCSHPFCPIPWAQLHGLSAPWIFIDFPSFWHPHERVTKSLFPIFLLPLLDRCELFWFQPLNSFFSMPF